MRPSDMTWQERHINRLLEMCIDAEAERDRYKHLCSLMLCMTSPKGEVQRQVIRRLMKLIEKGND
jgi:hypothetical protein